MQTRNATSTVTHDWCDSKDEAVFVGLISLTVYHNFSMQATPYEYTPTPSSGVTNEKAVTSIFEFQV